LTPEAEPKETWFRIIITFKVIETNPKIEIRNLWMDKISGNLGITGEFIDYFSQCLNSLTEKSASEIKRYFEYTSDSNSWQLKS
jgi:hypothetical protein